MNKLFTHLPKFKNKYLYICPKGLFMDCTDRDCPHYQPHELDYTCKVSISTKCPDDCIEISDEFPYE